MRLLGAGIIEASAAPRWRALRAWHHRLTGSRIALGVIVVAAAALTHAALSGRVESWRLYWLTPSLRELGDEVRSAPWWWYTVVGRPLLLVLFARFLWHWLVWSALVIALARFPLRLRAAHADGAGGIAFLGTPLLSFRFAIVAIVSGSAAAWFDQILQGHAIPATFASALLVMLGASVALAHGPYLALSPMLIAAKRRDGADYWALLCRYLDRFAIRWTRVPGKAKLLGHPDFQSLADLGASFQVVKEMRSTVFDRNSVFATLGASLVPIVVVLGLRSLTALEILARLFPRLFLAE